MANTPYENFVLADAIEDQFKSHLNLVNFCTVNNDLVLNDGMKILVHVYSATDSVEKVAPGVGNTKTSTASFTEKEYDITCAQGRFEYKDEDLLKDPLVVDAGVQHIAVDMFNTGNSDIYAEFAKATLTPSTASPALNFDLFADIGALIKPNSKTDDEISHDRIFAFLNPADVATLRKNCKETLQYVEAYARQGYIGSVAGVDIFTKADAVKGTVVGGTSKAVTWFNKKGAEAETDREKNTRVNTVYGRKYYVVALTDTTQAFKVVIA